MNGGFGFREGCRLSFSVVPTRASWDQTNFCSTHIHSYSWGIVMGSERGIVPPLAPSLVQIDA